MAENSLRLHADAARAFDEQVSTLCEAVVPCPERVERPDHFRPDIFRTAHITKDDVIGEFKLGITDGLGNEMGRYFKNQIGEQVGLIGEPFQKLQKIAANLQQSPAFRDRVSYRRVLDTAFEWVTASYRGEQPGSFAEYVVEKCQAGIREIEFWVPIYRLHIQEDFPFGPVVFKNIAGEMLGEWEQSRRAHSKNMHPSLDSTFRSERKKLQGTAAVVVRVFAEPERGYELAFEKAQTAVALLNFFHPSHVTNRARSYTALLGQENSQTKTVLLIQEGKIRGRQQTVLDRGPSAWFLNRARIHQLRAEGLDNVGAIWIKEPKTDFESRLLNSLVLYSKSSLRLDFRDRLIYIFAALESMLLRDSNEPIQKNIGERMAFLIGRTKEERKNVSQVVGEIYKLRSSFIHHGKTVHKGHVTEQFMTYAWTTTLALLLETDKFETKDALLNAIEDRKFQ